ncbi:ATPase [Methanocaldococcus vulcanius M7]|uniref:ATPase n=1 Tax=Methanocaldococcus vulcanius (strain ATCC 700851 / DSM 12094 / M7) TaxID=579137 RepID=C9RF49_METVM|nr:ATP-binding protein [Methanocaldococcus vulcanius]ACX72201.1 ATPase [Methanocaldococcus vulcanius M7]
MKFFNREKEINEILRILNREPDDIYFIYGPLNSGKTTLINHIINNELKKCSKKYAVFYVNFREYDISSMDNFVEALFEIDENSKEKKIKSYIESFTTGVNDIINLYYGIKVPEPILDKLFGEKERGRLVFKFIRDLFMSLHKKGIQPVFILDELQMIKDIVMNGGKPLLKSLFQFLVSLTKERHIAHVFCLSSDSLFIEYVYNAGELRDRADYILVDDFDKQTALKFMDFLAVDNNIELNNEDKELIYSYVGGKPKLIVRVINKLGIMDLKDVLELMLKDDMQKLKYFLNDLDYIKPKVSIKDELIEIKKEDIIEALKLFKNTYEISDDKIPEPVYIYLIKENILFLDPIRGILKPQSYLVWNAIKRLL